MAEEYSRQLAQRTRPARAGVHCAMAPFGYTRIYPPVDPSGHRPPGRLEPDPATAWIVTEMFTRYAQGGWSTPSLALWMNTDPRVPKPRVRCNRDGQVISADQWTSAALLYILRSPVYSGAIRYNVELEGVYDRAAPSDAFTVENCHPPLVEPAVWFVVQERLDAARCRSYANVTATPTGRHVALGSGLLHCAGCGGRMYLNRIADGDHVALYLCGRHLKGSPCSVRGYKTALAHAALLAELRRLRRAPWTPQSEHSACSARTASAAPRSLPSSRR